MYTSTGYKVHQYCWIFTMLSRCFFRKSKSSLGNSSSINSTVNYRCHCSMSANRLDVSPPVTGWFSPQNHSTGWFTSSPNHSRWAPFVIVGIQTKHTLRVTITFIIWISSYSSLTTLQVQKYMKLFIILKTHNTYIC